MVMLHPSFTSHPVCVVTCEEGERKGESSRQSQSFSPLQRDDRWLCPQPQPLTHTRKTSSSSSFFHLLEGEGDDRSEHGVLRAVKDHSNTHTQTCTIHFSPRHLWSVEGDVNHLRECEKKERRREKEQFECVTHTHSHSPLTITVARWFA